MAKDDDNDDNNEAFRWFDSVFGSEPVRKAVEEMFEKDKMDAVRAKLNKPNYDKFVRIQEICQTLESDYGCQIMSLDEIAMSNQAQIKIRLPFDFTFADDDNDAAPLGLIRDMVNLSDGVNFCGTGLDDCTIDVLLFIDGIFLENDA